MSLEKRFQHLRKKHSMLFHLLLLIIGILIILLPLLASQQKIALSDDWKNILYNISAALLTVWLIFMLRRLFTTDATAEFQQEVSDKIQALAQGIERLNSHLGYQELLQSGPSIRIPKLFQFRFANRRLRQYIGLVRADIREIKFIDIWVNSENTNMQLSRYYEGTISGIIRYLGAKRNEISGEIEDDIIFDRLAAAMGENHVVAPATVIPTDPGSLKETHRVKKIFHVAAVYGRPGEGYRPVDKIEDCITRSLEKANAPEFAGEAFESILFPLMGTGHASGNLPETAQKLIDAAIRYVETHPGNRIKKIYFLTFKDSEYYICHSILDNLRHLEEVGSEKLPS